MLRNRLLLSSIAFTCVMGLHAMEDISDKSLIPQAYGNVSVLHDSKGFAVSDGYTSQRVQNAFVDKEMRGLSNEKLAKYLAANYVRVSRADDGEYVLRSSGRLQAGGALGAAIGFHIGKWTVWGLGHGSILLAAAASGWGAPATFLSMEAQLYAPIEAASTTAGLAMGIIVGAGTGPV